MQDGVEGDTLAHLLERPPAEFFSPTHALSLVQRLASRIDDLHERGIGHGDIKPSNIVLMPEGEPVFIDALDFSAGADGELTSSVYAPPTGGRFERGRYALTKIAEELFERVAFESADARRLAAAILDCHNKNPALSTLSPLLDQVQAILQKLQTPEPAP